MTTEDSERDRTTKDIKRYDHWRYERDMATEDMKEI
jgi:hypothetical protein